VKLIPDAHETHQMHYSHGDNPLGTVYDFPVLSIFCARSGACISGASTRAAHTHPKTRPPQIATLFSQARGRMEPHMVKPRGAVEPELISLAEACRRIGISPASACKLPAQEFVPISWLGKKRVVARRAVEQWLAAKTGEHMQIDGGFTAAEAADFLSLLPRT
jgi:hypothetical protein